MDNLMDMQTEGEDSPKRRGRPPRAETVTEAAAHDPETRVRSPRVPFQSGGKLSVPEHLIEKGYRYYWGIDRDGVIEQLQAAWYEFVYDNGKKVIANAGRGNAHYLMRVEDQYFNEDIAAQQRKIDELEMQDVKIGQGEYSPHIGRSGQGSAISMDRDLS